MKNGSGGNAGAVSFFARALAIEAKTLRKQSREYARVLINIRVSSTLPSFNSTSRPFHAKQGPNERVRVSARVTSCTASLRRWRAVSNK